MHLHNHHRRHNPVLVVSLVALLLDHHAIRGVIKWFISRTKMSRQDKGIFTLSGSVTSSNQFVDFVIEIKINGVDRQTYWQTYWHRDKNDRRHFQIHIRHSVSHYYDVIMGAMASEITSLTIVYSTVHSGADQRKHQSPASLAFVWGIHRSPVNSPHKWQLTRKMFPFDDVIMDSWRGDNQTWMDVWQRHLNKMKCY